MMMYGSARVLKLREGIELWGLWMYKNRSNRKATFDHPS